MKGVSGREWALLSDSIHPSEALKEKYGDFLAQLIANRGYEDIHEKIFDLKLKNLLPYSFIPNIEEGVERIIRAVKRRERIIIFGDYDVDGITATAILFEVLRKAGARVVPILPSRGTGYGLSERLLKLFSRYGDLLIAVDNGSSAVSEFDSFPIETIIIDHHNTPEDIRAKATLINPRLEGDAPEEMKALSSSAMCFYIATLLIRRLDLDEDPRLFLDLVAMGTVADVMPMNFLNRILVAKGLDLLRSISKGTVEKAGISALLEVARVGEDITSKEIAYSLAPRLNAPGRIGDPKIALEILLERDPLRARMLSQKIEGINLRRKSITDAVIREAVPMAEAEKERSFISLWSPRWHVGVLGIVAGRLSNQLGKPVAVLAVGEEKAVGSVRSGMGVNVYEGLNQLSEMFIKWGGHPGAAGITISRDRLEEFKRAAQEVFSHIPRELPPYYADMELSPADLTENKLRDIKSLEPFGEENPYPTFVSKAGRVEEVSRVNGAFRVVFDGVQMMCWEQSLIKHLQEGSSKRLLYSVMGRNLTILDVSLPEL